MPRTFYAISDIGACTHGDPGFCSGRTRTTGIAYALGKAADETGPAAANDVAFSVQASGSLLSCYHVECSPAIAAWASGTYDVAVDITTANMALTLNEIHLCRVSSACGAVSTIGSLTGIGRGLGSTGSVTHSVTGSADTANSTDKLVVVFVCSNSTMTGAAATPAVTVTTTAFDAPAQAPAPPVKVIGQSVMRATLH